MPKGVYIRKPFTKKHKENIGKSNTKKEIRICSIDGCYKKYFANGLCQKHYNKKYRKEHKKYFIEHFKQWREDNKEHKAEYAKQYHQDNREKELKRNKQWYLNNRKHTLEYARQYYNDGIMSYNVMTNVVPGKWFASMYGFNKREYLKIAEAERQFQRLNSKITFII